MIAADERVAGVSFDEDSLSVRLKDGRTISVPLGAPSKPVLLGWVHGIHDCSMPPLNSASIGRSLEVDTASTGQTSTKTLALWACFEERLNLNKSALFDLTSATPHICQRTANLRTRQFEIKST
jgi:hypothetical protein